MYDMILHVGDFAYDMDTVGSNFNIMIIIKLQSFNWTALNNCPHPFDYFQDNAHVGDEFMRQIESIAAYTPYMTCPGNHESA